MASADYLELQQIVTENGLLDKQPRYYTLKILSLLLMLALGIAGAIFMPQIFWMHGLNAVFLAFVFVQAGHIMHDAGHLQIFKSNRKNRICGFIFANLIISTSSGRWTMRHNTHHAYPNDIDLDPDVNMPFLAFSEDQALQKKGISKLIVKKQAFLWFPLLCIYGFYWRISNLVAVLSNLVSSKGKYAPKYPITEATLVVVNNLLYFGIVFFFMDIWLAIFFIVIHHALLGVYMASIFATNHKGMPFSEKDMDFMYMQTVTSRNVTGGALVDFFMGGLNYQIEHHLFPSMPRNNLSKARKIIKPYCAEHGFDYYETDFLSSYKELLRNFIKISAVLKPVTN